MSDDDYKGCLSGCLIIVFLISLFASCIWGIFSGGENEREKWCTHLNKYKSDYDRCLTEPDWTKVKSVKGEGGE